MKAGIVIAGSGAVSPAGWSAEALTEAVLAGTRFPVTHEQPDGRPEPLTVLRVPAPGDAQTVRHPRLRRASPVARFATGAALEALGAERVERVRGGEIRLGIVVTIVNACVTYTRRFFDEVLTDPSVASPILFPETVFNSPASHISAVLETTTVNYTLLGDSSQFLSGLDLAAMWLLDDWADGCLVVACEELDWVSTEATQLFLGASTPVSEGAGALYLERGNSGNQVELARITPAFPYSRQQSRETAAANVWNNLPAGLPDAAIVRESGKPGDLAIRPSLGFSQAATAWQAVTAHRLLESGRFSDALIPAIGTDQQAIGAHFSRNHA